MIVNWQLTFCCTEFVKKLGTLLFHTYTVSNIHRYYVFLSSGQDDVFSNSNYCELYWHIFRVYIDLWPNNYPHNLSPSICGYKKRNVSKPNKGCQTCYCSCLQTHICGLYTKKIFLLAIRIMMMWSSQEVPLPLLTFVN